ncbi:hypothetical protein [Phenylobacterium deserti]|uniref:Uncharacterized protein n=1 Tax=Phenylobacterium deserti TaxID=1914756 RepID=A0A328AUF7_9CAUL|nr:hypothetical protein [Phenylobacterium deserti]RAK57164.1 hypothetical protein DJ018_04210 [Phenylobacterium deserti]
MTAASAMSVAQAMEACASELSALARRCEALQHHLAPALEGTALVEEAQALDLMTQTLGALGHYLSALADDVPADAMVDPRAAAAGVTLTDLAHRLIGHEAPGAGASGDFEMFGGA